MAPPLNWNSNTIWADTALCALFRISGYAVDDDGRAVAGARITITPWKLGQSQSPPQIALPAGMPFRSKCCSPEVSIEVGVGAEVVANALAFWTTKVDHAFTRATQLSP